MKRNDKMKRKVRETKENDKRRCGQKGASRCALFQPQSTVPPKKRSNLNLLLLFHLFFLFYCYESEIFNCKIKNSGNRTGLRNDPEPYGCTVQFPDARTNLLSVALK